jgi:Protein of unknown function (DUF1592)/Protein of unknown function (DUF1588)/Protein of unknown function (DUF1587)/Protein of unknown function (DUF1585)/Protein of unknown function (DUF1595)/Planctomycete cytochrome C
MKPSHSAKRVVFLCLVASHLALECRAQSFPSEMTKIIDQHCVACHDGEAKEGNPDLLSLTKQPITPDSLETWIKVHDRVQTGEMPPAGEPRLSESSLNRFLTSVAEQIVETERRMLAETGRSIKRRLNRYEYENSVRDLLSLPYLKIKDSLPEDRAAHGYNKTGEALDVSHVQLARYLRTAESALREAVIRQVEKPKQIRRRYYAWDQLKFTRGNGPPIRKTYPVLGYELRSDLNVRPARKPGRFIRPLPGRHSDPARKDEEAVVTVMSTYEHVEIQFDEFRAPFSGRYRLRLAGYTVWMAPDFSEVTKGRRAEPITIYSDTPPRTLRRLGHFDFGPQRSVQEIEVWLKAGETIRPDASRLVRSRPPHFQNPLLKEDGMPGVAFQWMEVDGPLFESWPPPGHKLLFGDLATVADSTDATDRFNPKEYPKYERGTSTTEPNELDVLDGIYNAHNQPPRRAHVLVESRHPSEDADRLLSNFLRHAYRRPVSEADHDRFLALILDALAKGHSFTDSMIAGYTAVLGSPEYLYLHAEAGPLDGHALAERLACFLWNSPPDEELLTLAASGELLDVDTRHQQVERLLDDSKSRRFVDAFLDYWLDLRHMAASDPDSELYPEYQLDDALVESMPEETQLYFHELIKGDLGVRHVVDSDFILVNERLATLYGFDDVIGAHFRPVELDEDSPRGGLMTQASVLKVTANGTTTSPVTRGAWIMERILGHHVPPPPPSVQAIESDVRGASTIREQLALHRSHESCNVCHAEIDPAGFALENFDVMGGWRDRYRTTNKGTGDKVAGIGHNGSLNRYRIGQAVDASGELPDGQAFKDIGELKKLLLSDEEQLARNLVGQLAIYATGAPIRFSDRRQIEVIIKQSEPRDYGVRTLIHELVNSELFLNK